MGFDELPSATGTGVLGQEAARLYVYGSETHSSAGERAATARNGSRRGSLWPGEGWERGKLPPLHSPEVKESL